MNNCKLKINKRKIACVLLSICVFASAAPLILPSYAIAETGDSVSSETQASENAVQAKDAALPETTLQDSAEAAAPADKTAEGTESGTETAPVPEISAPAASPSDPGDPASPAEERYAIKAVSYVQGVLSTVGGTISSSDLSEDGTAAKGSTVTFTIKPKAGYKTAYLLVDGVKISPAASYKLTGITCEHKIEAHFTKITLRVMIDPGHYQNYNKGCVTGYYEGNQMWKLGSYLVWELNKYPGIYASRTKSTIMNYEMGVYYRGLKAKGYDIIISMHSNWDQYSSTDYALSIVSSGQGLYEKAKGIGTVLAKTVKSRMAVKQGYQVWIRKQSDGRDFYGVIRGAASVNVPAVILEHSFHSNVAAAKFLMDRGSLDKLAAQEAAAIAGYYGIRDEGIAPAPAVTVEPLSVTKPAIPANFRARAVSSSKIRLTWSKTSGATSYIILRSHYRNGSYRIIKDSTLNYFTSTGLMKAHRYYYKIKAVKTVGNKKIYGNTSAPVTAVTLAR